MAYLFINATTLIRNILIAQKLKCLRLGHNLVTVDYERFLAQINSNKNKSKLQLVVDYVFQKAIISVFFGLENQIRMNN